MTETSNSPAILPSRRLFGFANLPWRMFPIGQVRSEVDVNALQQSRERRDFILEKLADNPNAFASEQDVRGMMSIFPRDF